MFLIVADDSENECLCNLRHLIPRLRCLKVLAVIFEPLEVLLYGGIILLASSQPLLALIPIISRAVVIAIKFPFISLSRLTFFDITFVDSPYAITIFPVSWWIVKTLGRWLNGYGGS